MKVVFRAWSFMKRGSPHPIQRLFFFSLLISSVVISILGLISKSMAVVIGEMIVDPLMEPILSPAFGFDDLDINISVIPNCVCRFDNQTMN